MTNVNGGKWIRPEKRLAIYLRDRFECGYCGCDLRHAAPRELTLDHLVPRVDGGSNDHRNLVTSCLSCNSRRRHTPWTEYADEAAARRIASTRELELNLELARAILADRTGNRSEESK